ncbi:MAG TPA: ATP-binding protein [Polyangiaceae bacterium]|nr:ATP-binding protein [Polyangiaceae bacterium]
MAGDVPLYRETFRIRGDDFERGGEVATHVKDLLKRFGLPPDVVRRVSIANFEAEMNVVMYAEEAELELLVFSDAIRVAVQDRGPGIADVAWALQEGHSTATEAMRARGFGAGLGLPNIRRHTDEFSIESAVGSGTTLRYVVRCGRPEGAS